MSKFHSTMSRREFMKGLGLAGAGLGAAAASAPVFHDLDGVITSQKSRPLPWWISEKDKPTTDIDYSIMKRYDQRDGAFNDGTVRYWGNGDLDAGKAVVDAASAVSGPISAQYLQEGKPGFALRDKALGSAKSAMRGGYSFLGKQKASTPEKRGVSKWQGTPEENFMMIRNAAKIWGATHVAAVELETSTTQKLVWSWDEDYKKLEFEDIPIPTETDTKKSIPNACRYAVVFNVPASVVLNTRVGEPLGDVARSYDHFWNIQNQLMEFIRGLGYQSVGQTNNNALMSKPALSVLGGTHEMSRTLSAIAPLIGMTPRPGMLITDLPIAPSKPIDAGIWKFCHTCKKCADACPVSANSFDDEPTYEPLGRWCSVGAKRFQVHSPKCRVNAIDGQINPCRLGNWNTCMRACTFSKVDAASVHEMVQQVVATTPLFNGFFRRMDDMFGYNTPLSPDDWWQRDILPFDQDLNQGQFVRYND
jgi:epoxyqueuosine reductase